jgi:hypothetical protein
MSVPKGFRKNINFINQHIGFEQRQDILDDIDYKGTFLPKGISYEDVDQRFVEFIDKDLEIVIDGEKVPVLFLTLQRWSEFSKTWQISDKFKNIKMPFITVVRQPNPQVGTNQAGLYNIPGRQNYTYMKVPTFEGGIRGVDTYKIPQPVSVDFIYEVRLFCNRMRDLNKLNFKVQQAFQSIQFYVRVNGHPMPIVLENIGDESNIDDFENRRFYVQPFEMKLIGYIQDSDQFEVIPSINRAMMVLEISDKIVPKMNFDVVKRSTTLFYNFVFKPKAKNEFKFIADYKIQLISIDNIENTSNIQIFVDNVEVFNGLQLPIGSLIIINAGSSVNVKISKNFFDTSKFMLIANIL